MSAYQSRRRAPATSVAGAPSAAEARQANRINRGILLSFGTGITAMVTSTVTEVMANKLSQLNVRVLSAVLNHHVLWSIAGLALAALVALIAWLWVVPPGSRVGELPVFPPRVDLLGRDDLVRRVVSEVRRTRVVIVHGPAGIGASAIATNAAWELAATADRLRYVDLRGPDPDVRRQEGRRRVAIRVLRSLGIAPGPFQNPDRAGDKVAAELRRGRLVLVLDNVHNIEQVGWLLRRVTEGYVIAVGEIPASVVPGGVAHVAVRALPPDAALALMCAQDHGDGRSDRRAYRWAGRLGPLFSRKRREDLPPASVAARIQADQPAADELAERFLKHPRIAIRVGSWLAANPQISIKTLLDDLSRGVGNAELEVILRDQLAGASGGARQLLALLAVAPVAECGEAAAAALAGKDVEWTAAHLKELADRSLVEWTRPTRCRVVDEARRLAGPIAPALRDRAWTRLVEHFAALCDVHAEALTTAGQADQGTRPAVEWFETEDATLLRLLRMPKPPVQASPHLWRIADGLEVWFMREGRTEDRRATAAAMTDAASAVGDGTAQVVGLVRLAAIALAEGAFGAAQAHLEEAERCDDRSGRSLPQHETGRAIWNMVVTGDLTAAADHLDRCRRGRTRGDKAGRLIDLINIAALRIEEGDHDAAHACLSVAVHHAADTDPAAYAHARELNGVVAWRRGHEQQARAEWAAAATLYQEHGDDLGLARCLQHEAATLVGGPERERARDMLARGLELRATDVGIGTALAHLYLGACAAAAGRPGDAARHRAAGLAALAPWRRQPSTPSQVAAVRARLAE